MHRRNTTLLFYVTIIFYNIILHTHIQATFETDLQNGTTQQHKKKYARALTFFEHALYNMPPDKTLRLKLANCFLALGNACFHTQNTDHALHAFNNILRISPNIAAAHHNIAFTLAEKCGQHKQALKHYEQTIKLKPNDAEAHFCYALSLLATGNLYHGFRHYEWRWKRSPDKKPRRHFTYPLEKQLNMQDIKNKRIVLRAEQGLGDTLHFIRYAQILKNMGATIIVEIQKPLVPLLSLCDYIDEIIPIGEKLPPFDYQTPLTSLAHILRTPKYTIPQNIPYLRTDATIKNYWQQKLAHDTNFKIGICWQGSIDHGPLKFMPFHYFAQLAKLPQISVYSLQKKDTNIIDTGDIISFENFDINNGPFMDTAALMQNLDLIITVDTSIAHLAGGLGIPVWVILPFPAEWRWLIGKSHSPWYPTMRLFRQKKVGEWDDVVQEIKYELLKQSRSESKD